MDQVYVQGNQVGLASYHFEQIDASIDENES